MMATRRLFTLLLLALTLGLGACETFAPQPEPDETFDAELVELADWMSGSFETAKPPAASGMNYRGFQLETAEIWTDRKDGLWLYSEQAAAGSPDRPFRQRVYHLSRGGDGAIISEIYSLPNGGRGHLGAYKNPSLFSNIDPSKLQSQEKGHMVLRRMGPRTFLGSTQGNTGMNSQLTVTPIEMQWSGSGSEDATQVFLKKGI
ncbi:MAG: chromophore lyase CpcT/CpeT [Planctomycetota bacterium]